MSTASCGARRGKKRKLSSAKDKESVSTGLKSEVGDESPTTADTGQLTYSKDLSIVKSNVAVLLGCF